MMQRLLLASALLLALLAASPNAASDRAAFADCAEHLPYGAPTLGTASSATSLCKRGYALSYHNDYKIPFWVAYRLGANAGLGCQTREAGFYPESALPKAYRVGASDYRNSGYDKGHMAAAADFANSPLKMHESFSYANTAPQEPQLNRQEWERLEESVRSWAYERGNLLIYVGPILDPEPKRIGRGVAVPSAFFKLVIDIQTSKALAFIMPQRAISKGDLRPWLTSIAEVERQAGTSFPLSPQADRDGVASLWPADLSGWRRKHRQMCSTS